MSHEPVTTGNAPHEPRHPLPKSESTRGRSSIQPLQAHPQARAGFKLVFLDFKRAKRKTKIFKLTKNDIGARHRPERIWTVIKLASMAFIYAGTAIGDLPTGLRYRAGCAGDGVG